MGLSLGLFGHLILSHMDQRIMSAQPQDGVLFVWAFKWWPFAAAHHLPLFYTNFDWAPAGVNLTWATTIPGPSFLLNWLTTGHTAFFSFNMTELAAPALAAWTAYLLCRRITRAFFPSLIGGFFFGFSASLMDEIGQGHPSLTLMFLAPVAAYLIYRLLEGSIHPLLFMPLFAGVLYFQLTIGTEVFATMSVVGLLCALVLMAFGPNRRRIALLKAIPPVAGGYLLAMAACWPLLHAAFFGPRIDKAIHFNTIGYGAKNGSEFLRYLTPGRFSIFWGQFGHQWGDNPWYLGVPLILVILAFLITERRRRATWAVFAGFLVILVFSLGDQMPGFPGSIEPWRLLSSIPMLSIAQPGRLVTYGFLLVAVLVAMWLAQAKRPWLIPLRWLLVLAAAVTTLPNFSVDVWTQVVPVPAFFTSNDYQKYIDRGQVVWVVSTHPSRQLTWQAGTGLLLPAGRRFLRRRAHRRALAAARRRLERGAAGHRPGRPPRHDHRRHPVLPGRAPRQRDRGGRGAVADRARDPAGAGRVRDQGRRRAGVPAGRAVHQPGPVQPAVPGARRAHRPAQAGAARGVAAAPPPGVADRRGGPGRGRPAPPPPPGG